MSLLTILKESECSCDECKSMCRRPCWGTPNEIRKIIDAGFGDRLMVDYWCNTMFDDIEILCGALKGYEGKAAPFIPVSDSGCSFFKNGLCELHDEKLKPCEGRLSVCTSNGDDIDGLHKEVAMMWDSEEGRELVKGWRDKYERR